jgi:hypothetical protein
LAKKEKVLHLLFSLTTIVFWTRQDHNKNMCNMTRIEIHLKYVTYEACNNDTSCNTPHLHPQNI